MKMRINVTQTTTCTPRLEVLNLGYQPLSLSVPSEDWPLQQLQLKPLLCALSLWSHFILIHPPPFTEGKLVGALAAGVGTASAPAERPGGGALLWRRVCAPGSLELGHASATFRTLPLQHPLGPANSGTQAEPRTAASEAAVPAQSARVSGEVYFRKTATTKPFGNANKEV